MAQPSASIPISVVVVSGGAAVASTFTPPYALPATGTKVAISTGGRNVANDVKPSPHTNSSWQYALFQSYGGGSFSADYSPAGAYVLAGMGGHNAPPCFGSAIFDFTSARWSYVPNANGYDERRVKDVTRAETNGAPYLELAAVRAGEMPSPSHHYTLQVSPPKSVMGGARGAVVVTLGAAKTVGGADSSQAHRFDLATGLWTRASQNLLRAVTSRTPYTGASAAYDPATRCIYVSVPFPHEGRLACLDLADGMWKKVGAFPAPRTRGVPRSIWIDDRRRLLLYLLNNAELWALELNAPDHGPVRLRTVGEVPNTGRRWEEYPLADGGDGAFYSFSGVGPAYASGTVPLASTQALWKLAPPAGDALADPWEFSLVPIRGGISAQYTVAAGAGAHHESRFFYVSALRCFAWIPNGSGPVELIKP